MSIESVMTESYPDLEWEESFRDRCAEKVSWVARQFIDWHLSHRRELWGAFVYPYQLGHYGQKNGLANERVRRIISLIFNFVVWSGTLAPAFVALGIQALSEAAYSKDYHTMKGIYKGEVREEPKLLFLNPHMLGGTTPLIESGLDLPEKRYDRLVATIRANNPDVIFLPEVSRSVSDNLLKDLKEEYHFFFYGMGERKLYGEGASFFLAIRGDIETLPEYRSLKVSPLWKEKGIFTLETKEIVYHFVEDPQMENLEEIVSKDFGSKKVVLCGSFGFDRSDPRYAFLKSEGFTSKAFKGEKTGSDAPYSYFHKLEETKESENIFLLTKGFDSSKKGRTYPMHDPKCLPEALSSEKLLIATLG